MDLDSKLKKKVLAYFNDKNFRECYKMLKNNMDTLLQGEVDNMLIYAFLLSKFESWDEAINHLEQHKESDFLNAGMDIYYFLSQLIDWGELDAARRIFDFKNIRRYCHYSDSIRDKLL